MNSGFLVFNFLKWVGWARESYQWSSHSHGTMESLSSNTAVPLSFKGKHQAGQSHAYLTSLGNQPQQQKPPGVGGKLLTPSGGLYSWVTKKNGIFQWVGSNTKSSSRSPLTIIRDSDYQLYFPSFSTLQSPFDEKDEQVRKITSKLTS